MKSQTGLQQAGLAIADNIQFQSLGKSTLFTQLRANYGERGYLGYFASDMQSSLFSFEDAQITGASASVDELMSIVRQDRIDTVQIEREYRDQNAHVQLYAVASVTPLGAESPGVVMGYFGGTQEISQGLLVDTQDNLITWSGNLRAKQNARFKNVTVPLAGNHKIDAVPQTRVTMSLSANENARGLEWNNKDFWINEVTTSYDATAGYVKQTVSMSEIVDGIGGSAITFPRVDDIVPAPAPTPGTSPSPEIGVPTFGTGFGTVYVMTSDTLGRTRAFSATSPEWSDISPSDSQFGDYILDPWNPAQKGYLTGASGVWKSSDLDQSSPTWELVVSWSTIESDLGATAISNWYKVIGSINFEDYVAVFFNATIGGFVQPHCMRSLDGGETWNTPVNIRPISNNEIFYGAADYVPHAISNNVKLYVAWESVGVGRSVGLGNISNDGGVSWSGSFVITGNTGGAFSRPIAMHCPYNGNESGNLAYMSDDGAGWRGLWKTENSFSSNTQVQTTAHQGGRRNMETHTLDNQAGYRWIPTNVLTITDNAFVNVTNATNTGFSGGIKGGGGFPTTDQQFYAISTSGIFVSTDRGENWIDKTGNWAFGLANWQDNGGVIVPLWTE